MKRTRRDGSPSQPATGVTDQDSSDAQGGGQSSTAPAREEGMNALTAPTAQARAEDEAVASRYGEALNELLKGQPEWAPVVDSNPNIKRVPSSQEPDVPGALNRPTGAVPGGYPWPGPGNRLPARVRQYHHQGGRGLSAEVGPERARPSPISVMSRSRPPRASSSSSSL